MDNHEATFYSLQLRAGWRCGRGDPAGHKVELIALPEGPGEPRRAHFEHWEPLSHRLSAVGQQHSFSPQSDVPDLACGVNGVSN